MILLFYVECLLAVNISTVDQDHGLVYSGPDFHLIVTNIKPDTKNYIIKLQSTSSSPDMSS